MADISFDDIPPSSQVSAINFDDIPQQIGHIQTIADQMGQGATFGFGDEIGAGFHGAAKYVGDRFVRGLQHISDAIGGGQIVSPDKIPKVNQTFAQDYDNQLAQNRENLHNEMQQRPALSIGSNLAGVLATGGLGASSKAGSAIANSLRSGNLPLRVLKGAALGATVGGVSGYGQGEGGVDQRENSAQRGSIIGAASGGAIPIAGATLNSGLSALGSAGRRVGAIFGNEGAQSTIGNQILAKRLVSEEYTPEEVMQAIADAKSSGLSPTLGEATGSSGILQTEKTIMRGTGAGANTLRDALQTRNTDTIPSTLSNFANQLDSKAGNVSKLYNDAAAEAGDNAIPNTTLDNISQNIEARLDKLGSVNNVETKALKQAQNIIDTAQSNGGDFASLHDAQKQLSNIYIDNADSGIQNTANMHVAGYRSQISNALKQAAPYNFPAANQAAMAKMAAGDITDALGGTNEGSLATLYNKVWAKPDLRADFLRKLPDDATRAQATNLFTQLGNVKNGFGGSDTAFNLTEAQNLPREAGLGFNPELVNPLESAPTLLNKIGSLAQPGVYNQIAKQSVNTDAKPLIQAMLRKSGNINGSSYSPLLSAPIAEGAASIEAPNSSQPSAQQLPSNLRPALIAPQSNLQLQTPNNLPIDGPQPVITPQPSPAGAQSLNTQMAIKPDPVLIASLRAAFKKRGQTDAQIDQYLRSKGMM